MNVWEGIDDRVNIDKSCLDMTPAEWNELERKAIAAQIRAREESERIRASWNQQKVHESKLTAQNA